MAEEKRKQVRVYINEETYSRLKGFSEKYGLNLNRLVQMEMDGYRIVPVKVIMEE